MQNKVMVKEIFTSIQGEGPYVGVNQLFIRFSECNLRCRYCDTDFKTDLKEYDIDSLVKIVNEAKNIHSVSLTGGEPLMEAEFLRIFLPKLNKKVYLETNGTLYENLDKVADNVDIISADFKLDSVTKSGRLFNEHEKFIKTALKHGVEIFVKVVFDENIKDEEIEECVKILKKYDIELILQPKTNKDNSIVETKIIKEIFNKFVNKYQKVRLIVQMHKFINVE